MQVPRENFYKVCIGNPPQIKVLAWWTSNPCAKRGIGVQTISSCAESRWMGKGKWVHQVIARSDLVARWKMWCPGCSWGVWHCLELGRNWEQPVKRGTGEEWDMKPHVLVLLFCQGAWVAAAFAFATTSAQEYTCEWRGLGVQAMLKWLLLFEFSNLNAFIWMQIRSQYKLNVAAKMVAGKCYTKQTSTFQ